MESLRENICCIHIHLFYYIIKHFYSKRVLILFHAMCTNFPKFSEYVAIAKKKFNSYFSHHNNDSFICTQDFLYFGTYPLASFGRSSIVTACQSVRWSQYQWGEGDSRMEQVERDFRRVLRHKKIPQTHFKICKTVIRPALYGAEHRQYEEQHILEKLEIWMMRWMLRISQRKKDGMHL